MVKSSFMTANDMTTLAIANRQLGPPIILNILSFDLSANYVFSLCCSIFTSANQPTNQPTLAF